MSRYVIKFIRMYNFKVFDDFEVVLCNELKTNIKNDIILDLTPQSKLFSFKLLLYYNKLASNAG